jgi:hypothetical protein
VSSNSIALCLWRIPEVLTGLAAVFCANFLRLLSLSSLVNTTFELASQAHSNSAKSQNSVTTVKQSRSTRLLVFILQWLGFGRKALQSSEESSYTAFQTLGLRSDLPSTLQTLSVWARARSLLLIPQVRTGYLRLCLQYQGLQCYASPVLLLPAQRRIASLRLCLQYRRLRRFATLAPLLPSQRLTASLQLPENSGSRRIVQPSAPVHPVDAVENGRIEAWKLLKLMSFARAW